jgi:hypothetical protein
MFHDPERAHALRHAPAVTLCSCRKASHFEEILLLVSGTPGHGRSIGCGTRCLHPIREEVSGRAAFAQTPRNLMRDPKGLGALRFEMQRFESRRPSQPPLPVRAFFSHVAVEVIEHLLDQMLPSVDSINDLQRPAGTWLFAERSQKQRAISTLPTLDPRENVWEIVLAASRLIPSQSSTQTG